MRAYRKRTWASLIINMTPLIDVVFLIIIFFLMMINFSDILIREVTLPIADESRETRESEIKKISITIQSETDIFVGRKKATFANLVPLINTNVVDHRRTTIQLRGDEDLPYTIIEKVMGKIAATGVTQIEFSTRKENEE
jgi:biopolymer transport protein ExbD